MNSNKQTLLDMLLALYDKETNKIESRGLTSDMVDHYLYSSGEIRRTTLVVIEDISDDDFIIDGDGSIVIKDDVKINYLGFAY